MTAARRPAVVAFDVVETLFSLAPVAEALQPLGVALDLFFARLLRDGMALTAAGDFRPFTDVARAALAALAPDAGDDDAAELLDAFGRLPPHRDVHPALRALSAEGVRIVTLTNGGAENTTKLLDRSGLAELVEHVISVDEARAWKPAVAPYRLAADIVGHPPSDLALVAVHSWDVHGAHAAGLVTGWCSRLEDRYPTVFTPPDVSGADLVTVVGELLALPR